MNGPETLVAVVSLSLCTICTADESPEQTFARFHKAILAGQPQFVLRYRYEHVAADNFAEDANASTLKLRATYGTGVWRNWSAFTEFDYVAELLVDDFNSGAGTSSPARTQYPVVADPKGADLNQLYFDYVGIADTRLRFGRQRILIDNHRFVGGVGWRQNEQTYDGVSGAFNRLPRTTLSYSYVARVNRIFGERSTAGKHDVNAHFLDGRIDLTPGWQLVPYYYYIENDDVAGFSVATVGAFVAGNLGLDDKAIKIRAEFASQSDAGNNPVNYNAPYFHVKGSRTFENGLSLALGFESLGGDVTATGQAFKTPLATLHLFQGWADQFLATPDEGIKDYYLSVTYQHREWTLRTVYHDFSAAEGPSNWGREVDVSASRSISKHYKVLLKAALFDADDAAYVDTRKLWIQLMATY